MDIDWLGAILVSMVLAGMIWWRIRRGRVFGFDRAGEPRLFWMKIADLAFWLVLAVGLECAGERKVMHNLH